VLVIVTPEQLSVAVGGVQLTTAWHDDVAATFMLGGQLMISGRITSMTVTVNRHVEVLPLLSFAVYITSLLPTGNWSPGL
jgi:hypothetical protein